ncbi:MAG: hypothetical protein N5P05_002556 [Chroococcopsis gigantea SAG 12.99]|jgi:photosystem II oxygen-evolving enhancer protein 2|nr:photosystem II reaction center PsbP family protein [Chlorogloea purpurea SAG 13.99]MDV3000950.1 hypothetical protein [Chroococcopsis gigantea SAG 12.99]
MIKSLLARLILIMGLILASCSNGTTGLQSYTDGAQGYQFLYPSGWVSVNVKNSSPGVDIVFHDLIEQTENVSVIISDVSDNKTLADLGTPTEVGYRFLKEKQVLNPNIDLINAEAHQDNNKKDYYLLEYQIKGSNTGDRHNLASVVINKDKLYTFNVSTTERRWQKAQDLLTTVVNSFRVN